MMIALKILSAVVLWGYVVAMALRHGAEDVLSAYAYRGRMWLFTACLGTAAVLLMPVLVEEAPDGWQWSGFGAAAALCFVAAAPHYREEESKVHNTAAAVAAGMAVVWALATEPWAIAAAVAEMLVVGVWTRKWWLAAETGALAMVYF